MLHLLLCCDVQNSYWWIFSQFSFIFFGNPRSSFTRQRFHALSSIILFFMDKCYGFFIFLLWENPVLAFFRQSLKFHLLLWLQGRILTVAGITLALCAAPFVSFANLVAIAVRPTWIAVAVSETLRKVCFVQDACLLTHTRKRFEYNVWTRTSVSTSKKKVKNNIKSYIDKHVCLYPWLQK